MINRYSLAREIRMIEEKPIIIFTINDTHCNDKELMIFRVTASEQDTKALASAVRSIMDQGYAKAGV